MEPNRVPLEYCHRWILAGLKIGERNYTLFIICGLIMYISLFILWAIPTLVHVWFIAAVGNVGVSLLMFFYSLATMRLTHALLREPTLKTDLDSFLKYAFDATYFEKFKMPILIIAGLAVLAQIAPFLRFTPLILACKVAAATALFLFIFSAFMMLQNPLMDWKVAFNKVYQGLTLNMTASLATLGILGIFAVVSLALCLAPFLLYFVPMTFSVGYLVYASIFESLDIEAVITEWGSKRVVETHLLPPEA